MDFSVGDIVQMKKSHPCGSAQWEILRTGIDFRIKCCGCGPVSYTHLTLPTIA